MCKSDRELLELAAKAAGLKIRGFSPVGSAVLDEYHEICWNPLADDGDAFRLALQLRIRFERHHQPFVAAFAPDIVGRFEEPEGDDIYAATRRAIVRSAAAIGEAMQ